MDIEFFQNIMNFLIRKIAINHFLMIKSAKPLVYAMFGSAKQGPKIDFNKDYYSVLGVNSKSSTKAIRVSYIKLVKKHHPDAINTTATDPQQSNQSSQSSQSKTNNTQQCSKPGHNKFIEIQEAYEILSNDELRKQYDYHLQGKTGESVRQQYRPKRRQSSYQQASEFQSRRNSDGTDQSWSAFRAQVNQSKWEKEYEEEMKSILQQEERMRKIEKQQREAYIRMKKEEDKKKYGDHFYEKSAEELEKLRRATKNYNHLYGQHYYHQEKQPRKMCEIMRELGFVNLSNYWVRMKKKMGHE